MPGQSDQSQSRTSIGRGSIEIAPGAVLPVASVHFSATRAGGPGGQNVNKVNSRVQLRIAFDEAVRAASLDSAAAQRLAALASTYLNADGQIVIASGRFRSQLRNREACLGRLRDLIVRARSVPRKRRKTKPSRGAVESRLEHKRQRGQAKQRRAWKPESS